MQVLYPEAAAAAGGKGKESKASLTPARIARLDTIGAAKLCPPSFWNHIYSPRNYIFSLSLICVEYVRH